MGHTRLRGGRQGGGTSPLAASRSDGTLVVALACVIAAALLYAIFGFVYGWPAFVE